MANTIDERLMAANEADRKRQDAGSGADEQRQREMGYEDQLGQAQRAGEDKERQADAEPQSLRQSIRAAKQAMDLKQKVKDKLEEKVAAPIGILKAKLLNLIPGYGPYVAFKNAVLMKKGKFTLVDIMIMLFSNLNSCFIVLAALVFISLIITWATNPITAVKAIMDLGWDAVSALVSLFKGLL